MSAENPSLISTKIGFDDPRLKSLNTHQEFYGSVPELSSLSSPIVFHLFNLEKLLSQEQYSIKNKALLAELRTILFQAQLANANFSLIARNEEAALDLRDYFGLPVVIGAAPVFIDLIAKAERSQDFTRQVAIDLQNFIDSTVFKFINDHLTEINELLIKAQQQVETHQYTALEQTQTRQNLNMVDVYGFESSMAQTHFQNVLTAEEQNNQEETRFWLSQVLTLQSMLGLTQKTTNQATNLEAAFTPLTQGRSLRPLNTSRAAQLN